jgi:hypothetical protein
MTLIDIELPEATPDDTVAASTPATTEARPPVAAPPTPATTRRPRPPGRALLDDLAEPLSRRWGLALVGAWVVVIAIGLALEPAAANPDAAPPFFADLLSTGLLATWGAMAAGIFQGRRLAAAASFVGAVGLLALTLGCPLSGHHSGIGAWWGIQIVGALSLLALSRKALRS